MELDPGLYFDHAATTPPLPEVVDAVAAAMTGPFGNPSSTHGFGDRARHSLEDSRQFLRGSVGAAELIFTSGGTEADFLGLVGAARARAPGRVLVGAADHAATLHLESALGKRYPMFKVPTGPYGVIEPETLFDAMGPDVRVVSILHGHNELGSLCDLEELVEVVRRTSPEAHVHVDFVQGYGKIDLDLDLCGADSLAVSAHKLHGPRGIGFLALSSKARLAPLISGGGQEGGLRGGTQNVAGAAGFACAAEYMLSQIAEHAEHLDALCERVLDGLDEEIAGVERLGDPKHRLPHVLSLRIKGVSGQALQEACAARGLAFSVGAACHGGKQGDNHVLRAIDLSKRAAREVFRLSFSPFSRNKEVDSAIGILIEEAERLLAIPAPSASKRGGSPSRSKR